MPKHHGNSNTLTKHYAALNRSAAVRTEQQKKRQQKEVSPQTVTDRINSSRWREAQVEAARAAMESSSSINGDGEMKSVIHQNETYTPSLVAYLSELDSVEQTLRFILDDFDFTTEDDAASVRQTPTDGIPSTSLPAGRPQRNHHRLAGPPPPPTWVAEDRQRRAAMAGSIEPVVNGRRVVTRQHPDHTAMHAVRRQAAEFLKFRSERNVLRSNLPAEPGLSVLNSILPREGSLVHWSLVKISRDWEINVQYLKYYLPTLEPGMKMVLVSYLGLYSPHGVGPLGLKLLFGTESANQSGSTFQESGQDAWEHCVPVDDDNDRITSLDLSFQIDDAHLSLSSLSKFLVPSSSKSKLGTSWQHTTPTRRIFPFLSALSLSYPCCNSPTQLWSSLLTILRNNPTLVALALANWPIPPEMFYTTPDSSAQTYPPKSPIATLRGLSRNSTALRWVDFSYCSWLDEKAAVSLEWDGGWRQLRTIVMRGVSLDVCDRIQAEVANIRGVKGVSIEVLS
ncbi:uncharacterized protein V1516DRAFT_677797 [Lipomyces oligophaga]|uniref:uncharacterized protein n=1 Tax=Lipomyces oligophaga TaxID=45792 RepID=UPI0034CFD4D6